MNASVAPFTRLLTLYGLANNLGSFCLVLLFHWPITVSMAQYIAILHYINLPTKVEISIFILCVYVQQGYVFGCVGLCSYIYIYICVDKKTGCLAPYHSQISR